MLRLILFVSLIALAACSAVRPTAAPAPGTFTIEPTISTADLVAGESFVVNVGAGPAGSAHYSISIDGIEFSGLSYDGTVIHEPTSASPARLLQYSSDALAASWTVEVLGPGTYELLVTVLGDITIPRPGGDRIRSAADKLFIVTVR